VKTPWETIKEGRALYANRETEPSDWGDWADENAAWLMDEIDRQEKDRREAVWLAELRRAELATLKHEVTRQEGDPREEIWDAAARRTEIETLKNEVETLRNACLDCERPEV